MTAPEPINSVHPPIRTTSDTNDLSITSKSTGDKTSWAWMTFIGTSLSAVINTIWAAIVYDHVQLSDVYAFLSDSSQIKANYTGLEQFLQALASTYHFDSLTLHPIQIQETNFADIEAQITRLLKEIPATQPIALDMTPGRKYMSAMMLFHGLRHLSKVSNIQRLYYLHLELMNFQEQLFPMIPLYGQTLYNLLVAGGQPITFHLPSTPKIGLDSPINLEARTSHTFIITARQLTLLLNGYWITKQRIGRVYAPYLDEPLFTFEFSSSEIKLTQLIPSKRYFELIQALLDQVPDDEAFFSQEIPVYQDLVDSFSMSGILSAEQEAVVTALIQKIRSTTHSGTKLFCLALDTNVWIRRVASIIYERIYQLNQQRIRARQIPLLLSFFLAPTVEHELVSKQNDKYTKHDSSRLQHSLGIHTFFNQPKRLARLFAIGAQELLVIRRYERLFVGQQATRNSTELADTAMLNEISAFEQSHRPTLVFLSQDERALQAATTKGIDCQPWRKAQKFEETLQVSWKQFEKLLFNLSQIFGQINLRTPSKTVIEGIWAGRNMDHWKQEQLRITSHGTKLIPFFQQYMQVLSKIT